MVLYDFGIVEFVVAPDGISQYAVALYGVVEYRRYLVNKPLPVVLGIPLIQEPAGHVYYHAL